MFSSYEGQQERQMGKIRGAFFWDAQGFGRLDADERRLHQLQAFTTMDRGISIFLFVHHV